MGSKVRCCNAGDVRTVRPRIGHDAQRVPIIVHLNAEADMRAKAERTDLPIHRKGSHWNRICEISLRFRVNHSLPRISFLEHDNVQQRTVILVTFHHGIQLLQKQLQLLLLLLAQLLFAVIIVIFVLRFVVCQRKPIQLGLRLRNQRSMLHQKRLLPFLLHATLHTSRQQVVQTNRTQFQLCRTARPFAQPQLPSRKALHARIILDVIQLHRRRVVHDHIAISGTIDEIDVLRRHPVARGAVQSGREEIASGIHDGNFDSRTVRAATG
mmetsp:Transcript_31396/g.66472  ORF Transcript_31396/g.66472 Transcript_31396/m.66472 type:complete len:268 (+) Transcript_31396:345-1148(+)